MNIMNSMNEEPREPNLLFCPFFHVSSPTKNKKKKSLYGQIARDEENKNKNKPYPH